MWKLIACIIILLQISISERNLPHNHLRHIFYYEYSRGTTVAETVHLKPRTQLNEESIHQRGIEPETLARGANSVALGHRDTLVYRRRGSFFHFQQYCAQLAETYRFIYHSSGTSSWIGMTHKQMVTFALGRLVLVLVSEKRIDIALVCWQDIVENKNAQRSESSRPELML
ncbi:hypothetical protein DdX_19963 [Ditylenchus destructor]|uniref:Secreted protein n=1 Tax=Ditylenchus destructor TaxID=166010 RepID=A0AAD4MI08_9BILA|nr:hypothetical protein DdX_19963 [Ditylenchus destructor]